MIGLSRRAALRALFVGVLSMMAVVAGMAAARDDPQDATASNCHALAQTAPQDIDRMIVRNETDIAVAFADNAEDLIAEGGHGRVQDAAPRDHAA